MSFLFVFFLFLFIICTLQMSLERMLDSAKIQGDAIYGQQRSLEFRPLTENCFFRLPNPVICPIIITLHLLVKRKVNVKKDHG